MTESQLHFRRHLAVWAILLIGQALAASLRGPSALLVDAQALSEPSQALSRGERSIPVDYQDMNQLELILARLGDYLPVLDLNYTVVGKRFDNGQLDAEVEKYYNEDFPANLTLDQLQLLSIKASMRMAPIPIHTSWGYESRDELKLSSYPVADESKCASQLGQLGARLDRLTGAGQQPSQALGPQTSVDLQQAVVRPTIRGSALFEASPVENYEAQLLYRSTDIPFLRYMETFGKIPSDVVRGNVKWYGSHSGCLDTRLTGVSGERTKFRYCMVALRSTSWPRARASDQMSREKWVNFGVHTYDQNLANFFIRIGVCLPETCDSSALDYQANVQTIEKLVKYNLMKPFNSDHYYLSDLYCLPDSRSPLRTVPWAGKLLVLAALLWTGIILTATGIHMNVERFYTKSVRAIRRQQRRSAGDGLAGDEEAQLKEREHEYESKNNEFKETDVLGLKHNWIRLNVYLWDQSKRLVKGVDLIDCLSLYSNWLKYTNRLKVAIARLHAEQERRERLRQKQFQLVEQARSRRNETSGKELGPESGDKLGEELSKRQEEQDSLDELDGDFVKRRVDTSSMNALKVIALLWIMAGHCIFYLGSTVANGAILKNYARQLVAFALANGALYITELFFVITGCLTAYLSFKYNTFRRPIGGSSNQVELSERGTGNRAIESGVSNGLEGPAHMESRMFKLRFWFMIVVNRYLRIVPTYLVVYSFVRLVSIYIGGSGQLWDYAVSTNSMRRRCAEESWLPVLTLTTNFVDIYGHCIVGGWYLSTDMQFMLMAVPFLLILAKCQRRPKGQASQFVAFNKQQQLTFTSSNADISQQQRESESSTNSNEIKVSKRLVLGYAIVFLAGIISAVWSMAYGILQSEVDFSYIIKFVPHTVAILSRNIAMYTNSIFRFRAFAFGLILGHLLYMYEFRLIKLPKIVQQHGAKLTTIIFSIGFSVMFLPVLYPKGKIVISHDMMSILMILSAGGIDIFLSVLIFLICIGKAPKIVLFFLNSPFWSVLSSLSLCAFLIHTEVIILLTSQLDPPPTVQYSLLVFVFCATVLITYVLALGLYLAFEMPVSRLIEAFMRKFFGGSRVVQSDNSTVVPREQSMETADQATSTKATINTNNNNI